VTPKLNILSPNWPKPRLSAFAALLLPLLLLAACSSGTSGSSNPYPATRAAQAAVPAIPGTAKLFVLNTGEPTFTITSNTVYDGQQKLVSVSQKRYAIVVLYAGRHTLSCAGMPATTPIYVELMPGQTYYLQTYVGWGSTNQICALLPPAMGEKSLAQIMTEKSKAGYTRANPGKN